MSFESPIPTCNPVEAALAQAGIDSAISLSPNFQSEIAHRLRMVESAVAYLAETCNVAEASDSALNTAGIWGVASLISSEIRTISGLHEALHHLLEKEARS